jgi:hypothetical protein
MSVLDSYPQAIHNLIDHLGLMNLHAYFDGHYPRFELGVRMLSENLTFDEKSQILELGSPLPFYSYPFVKLHCSHAMVLDLSIESPYWFEDIYFDSFNICNDKLAINSWDLIIMTEVWEHLPCNLLEVRNQVVDAIKHGGFLYTSFPLLGKNASMENYNKVWTPDFSKSYEHLREFTEETAREFLDMPELKILAEANVFTNAYHFYIKQVLVAKCG